MVIVCAGVIASMAAEANKDAAEQSLDIAKSALAAGNLEKAQRFAEKAMKLYPSDEVSQSISQSINDLSHSCKIAPHALAKNVLCSVPDIQIATHSSLSAHCLAKACVKPCLLPCCCHVHVDGNSLVRSCRQVSCLVAKPASILPEKLVCGPGTVSTAL